MAVIGELPHLAVGWPLAYKISDQFDPLEFDVAVILDCGGWSRTEFFEDDELNIAWPQQVIVVDHHATQRLTSGLHCCDAGAASTTQILTEMFLAWQEPIDAPLATMLLAGLAMDTAFFQHMTTTKQSLQVASYLLACGANLSKIVASRGEQFSVPALRLWGRLLTRMRYAPESRILWTVVGKLDMEETGASENDVSGLVGLMNRVDGLRLAILIREIGEDRLKVSLRTENENLDVGKIAADFGGGGHRRAAGFEVKI